MLKLQRHALLIFALTAANSVNAFGQSDLEMIDRLLDQVSLDSLTSYVEALSGVTPVMVSDSVLLYQLNEASNEIETVWLIDTLVTLANRRYLTNDVATYYVEQKLRSFGLEDVTIIPGLTDPWLLNVVAVKKGTTNPDRQYILCAHYDGVIRGPGADDNGSGTAAVLEAARILADVETGPTIIFALWDSEEIGLFGSAEYAGTALETGDDIGAVINLDMLGWDGDDDHEFEIHSDSASSFIAGLVVKAVQEHKLDLSPRIHLPGSRSSDHASFWDAEYQSVLLIEEFRGGDFNPHYHSPSDSLKYFNLPYFHEMSKLGLAMIARYALGGVGVASEAASSPESGAGARLLQNYPNPFSTNGAGTRITFSLPRREHVSVRVFDVLGREVATLVDSQEPPGRHTLTWVPENDVPRGLYLLVLESPTLRSSRKMTLI